MAAIGAILRQSIHKIVEQLQPSVLSFPVGVLGKYLKSHLMQLNFPLFLYLASSDDHKPCCIFSAVSHNSSLAEVTQLALQDELVRDMF